MKAQGPKGSFLFGAGVMFKENPLQFLLETAIDYPEISSFRFGPQRMHLLSNPEYAQYVLQKNYKNYTKGLKVRELRHFIGNGMPVVEGEKWRKQRKIAQPAFSREKIQAMAESIISCTMAVVEKWKKNQIGKELEMVREMKSLTLNIIGETLFSKDISGKSERMAEAVTNLINHTNTRIQNAYNFPIWLPYGGRKKFRNEKKYIDSLIYKIIQERKKNKASTYNDLLSMLMGTLNDEEIRDEILTMLLTGSESSAVMLAWIMYLLDKHKPLEDKLVKEIDHVTKGEKLNFQHLGKLSYTKAIIEEAMRIYPPIWVIARQAINDDEINGHKIKKRDGVLVSPYVMNHLEKFWKNPEQFHPERFLDQNHKKINSRIYMPFGGGPRACIGNHFAMLEMQIMLALFYQNFTFRYEGDNNLDMELGFNLRPKNGILIKPELRQ